MRFAPAEPVVIGACYISDLAENDADITGLTAISKRVAGYGAYLLFAMNGVKFDADYITAAKNSTPLTSTQMSSNRMLKKSINGLL